MRFNLKLACCTCCNGILDSFLWSGDKLVVPIAEKAFSSKIILLNLGLLNFC